MHSLSHSFIPAFVEYICKSHPGFLLLDLKLSFLEGVCSPEKPLYEHLQQTSQTTLQTMTV